MARDHIRGRKQVKVKTETNQRKKNRRFVIFYFLIKGKGLFGKDTRVLLPAELSYKDKTQGKLPITQPQPSPLLKIC